MPKLEELAGKLARELYTLKDAAITRVVQADGKKLNKTELAKYGQFVSQQHTRGNGFTEWLVWRGVRVVEFTVKIDGYTATITTTDLPDAKQAQPEDVHTKQTRLRRPRRVV